MTSRITALAVLAALVLGAAGCEQSKFDDSVPRVSGIPIDVTSSIDGRLWRYDDRIRVIDDAGFGRTSLPSFCADCIECDFRLENWPEDKDPGYVYWMKDSTYQGISESSAVIPAVLPTSQQIDTNLQVSLGVGKIRPGEKSGSFSCSMFSPVQSLELGISSKEEITSIAISSKEGVALCGKMNIDLKTISGGKVDFTLTEGKDTIRLTSSDRCFKPGNEYFASVLPGLEFTPVFTFTDTIGRKAVKALKEKVSTSAPVSLSSIDAGIEFDPTKIRPDTICLRLEFGNWTLTPALPTTTAGQSSTAGETYTYHYTSPTGYKENFPFIICKGTTSGAGYYEYITAAKIKTIKFDKTTAWIAMPVVSGMRIHRIAMTNLNSSDKGFKIQTVKGYTSEADKILHAIQYHNSTQVFEFNGEGQKETFEKQQYFIYFYYGSGGVWTDLTVEYTKVEEQ